MKVWGIAFLFLLISGPGLWAANNKTALVDARSHYKQAVIRHGQNSPEARASRQHLRAARRNYQAQRRRSQPALSRQQDKIR